MSLAKFQFDRVFSDNKIRNPLPSGRTHNPLEDSRSFHKKTTSSMHKEQVRRKHTVGATSQNTQQMNDLQHASLLTTPAIKKSASETPKTFEEGFEVGFQKGLSSRLQQNEEHFSSVVKELKRMVHDAEQAASKKHAFYAQAITDLLQAGLEHIFPTLGQYVSLAQTDLLYRLTQCLRDLQLKDVVIRLNPQMVPLLQSRVGKEGLEKTRGVNVVFKEDPTLSLGDCCLDWDNSTAQIIRESLLSHVLSVLDGLEESLREDYHKIEDNSLGSLVDAQSELSSHQSHGMTSTLSATSR